MTGQTLLDYMEILFPELQLQSGESDVTKGLLALNIAQDGFEALLAQEPDYGSVPGTITTTANVEYTAFPAGLLRLDRLQFIDPVTTRPTYSLERVDAPGDQALSWPWALITAAMSSTGEPLKYQESGSRIYWAPVPNATHTIRYLGFVAATSITAAGTFAYQDIAAFPLASLAVRIIKTGLDDNASDISGLSKSFMDPVIKSLSGHNRDGAQKLRYRYFHRT